MEGSSSTAFVDPPETVLRSFAGKAEADVVVIGSGIGRFCCAGLLARYGKDVLVLENHDLPGGAAHSFEVRNFKFDSGHLSFLVSNREVLKPILWLKIYLISGTWKFLKSSVVYDVDCEL